MMRRLLPVAASALLLGGLAALPASAQITYVGAGSMAAAISGNISPALPSGTTANDILLVHCYTRDTTDTTTVSGYTEIGQVDTASASHRWFWKRHSGSESNPTCTVGGTGDRYGRTYAFRGATTSGNPWNALGTGEQFNSEPMSVTGVTSGSANSMIVEMDGYADNNTASASTTATDPASFTDVYAESATGDDGSLHMAYAIRTAAGATGTITVDYNVGFTGGDESGALVLALTPAPIPCSGTDQCVQPCSQRTGAGTTATCTFSGNVTSGNLLSFMIGWQNGVTLNSVAGSAGCGSPSLTLVNNPTAGSNGSFAMAYGFATATGSCTVTATFSGSSGFENIMAGQEISGINATTPRDNSLSAAQAQASPGTGTDAVTSGTVTTTVDGDYLFACTYNDTGNTNSPAAGTNFTRTSLETGWLMACEYRVQTTAASGTAGTFTLPSNFQMITGMIPFQPAGGGPPATTHQLLLMGVGD